MPRPPPTPRRLPRGLCPSRGRRPDVLVQPEQVRGVVFLLECEQPLILLRTVSGPDPLGPLVYLASQIVDVDAAGRERLHRVPELTRPLHAPRSFCRLGA